MSTTKEKISTEEEARHIVGLDASELKNVPVKLRTASVCRLAFDNSPFEYIYLHIPEEHRTFAMALRAASDYGSGTKDFAEWALKPEWGISVSAFVALKKKGKLPNFKKVTDQGIIFLCYQEAFRKDAGVVQVMPKEMIPKIVKSSSDVNKILTHQVEGTFRHTWGGAKLVKFIPENLMTDVAIQVLQNRLEIAVKDGNTGTFFDAPSQYVTDELYELVLEKNPSSLNNIPEDRITNTMCRIAVQKDGSTLKYVPEEMQDAFYMDVVKSGEGLYTIPEDKRTDRLCTLAVESNPSQYRHIPQDKKSYALSLQAVDGDCEMIQFVPEELVDQEMMVRFIISIFRKTWKNDYSLVDSHRTRRDRGEEPIMKTVFDNFFKGKEGSYDRKQELRAMMHEVIARDAKLYFQLLNFSGENDVNTGSSRFNSDGWNTYFAGAVEFEHAVTAARTDIEVVGGFKQNVQARVWKEFLSNNK